MAFLSSILQVIAKLWAGFFFGVINFRNSGQFMHNINTPKMYYNDCKNLSFLLEIEGLIFSDFVVLVPCMQ